MESNDVSKFLEIQKKAYVKKKISEYISKGFDEKTASNKASQSWRSYVGKMLEKIIFESLKEPLEKQGLKLVTDNDLIRNRNLTKELELVKRLISIDYGEYLFLPDADIIVYKVTKKKAIDELDENDIKILAIISVKNSFRERGFETAYWKKKLSESIITSHIKVFMATPDPDNEISYIAPNHKPKKMRVILEYELDGIYLLKNEFDETKKTKHFDEIANDILSIK
ncbi:restriction endonuclease MjaVIP [Thermosipho melanesiensis]|uniref:Type II site-specific deoxyribonuclease n=2 Tax=Thermosipho melanesiensis TaxID=46541 RepID=A6LN27_THEM4|nr:BsaWI family type II restriction enzyme [Thermosipho melanesiensis]ABR31328.1 Type II site-specific deoxyribonuclease [Thermosipho melanesiensis BI429]APT74393.1 restriction endonuclease MjaVIP [Thermosipho melanesiensis]OOC36351.1 restriction endonuclease MjaVIP [Thermosipho melanesiensis]OOC37169.1 restriction endonuclease MjaVIP [Thermosipho melanesiensis]OOC37921.1 restriction endonuclease MjaVIP [Thermosipho melanesiensis]